MKHVLIHPGRSLSNAGAILFSLPLLVGCGILDEGNPEKIRVVMNGADGTSVQLITTNDFLVLRDQDGDTRSVDINSADTTAVTPPFRGTYSLRSEARFYMKVESEQPLPEPLTVKAFVDDEERFNRTSLLGTEYLEFTYTIR
jgi:hypothetical protein